MVLCEELYHLPPVKGKPLCMSNQSVKGCVNTDLWEIFQFAELTEVIRHSGDNLLIHILNKIRACEVDESVDVVLKERFINPNYPSFPTEALHFF